MARGSFTPKRLFRELRYEIVKALFLKEFLNAAILFFIINIPLTIFSMPLYISATIAVLFLVVRMIKAFRKQVVYDLEKGNPEVHELLRTAYDHESENSLLVQGLMYDLQKQLSTVSTGVLINPKRTIGKLFVIALLVFVPLAITSFAPFIIQENPLAGVNLNQLASQASQQFMLEPINTTPLNETTEYGDAVQLNVGDEALNVQIQSGGAMVDLSQEQDLQQNEFSNAQTSGEVDVVSSQESNQRVYDESEIQLINEYSCRQRGDCDE